MKFLNTADTIAKVRGILAHRGPVKAAVAYWGIGAVENLGITAAMDLEIVCDIRSGGCNPAEVRKLIKLLGKERVLTFDRLHSKAWIGHRAAIVGSSNASANGLGFEGKEAATLAEANIMLDDRDVMLDLNKWWSGTVREGAREITAADLRLAAKLRRKHRVIRPQDDYADLLAGLSANPAAFADRNLFIWIYEWGTFSEWAEAALEAARTQYHDPNILCWQDVESPPPPGSYVIDFNSEKSPPDGPRIYQLLADQPTFKVKKGSILLAKAVPNFAGLKLGSRTLWRAAAAKAAAAGGVDAWEADDFARSFLSSSTT